MTVVSNKSFDRAVKHRGRAMLAMDGVLAGAEAALWPAGQLNRWMAL